MNQRTIGERVEALRRRKGLTTTQLGQLVGISQAQISRLECGRQGFRSATLARIAKALGVRPVYFYLEEGADSPGALTRPETRLGAALADPGFRRATERAAEVFLTEPEKVLKLARAIEALLPGDLPPRSGPRPARRGRT